MLAFATRTAYAKALPVPEYQIKAAFLFNFIRFVDWPPASFSNPESPFVIGVLGDDPFGSYLQELISGEKVGNRPIVLKNYDRSEDINCHILFIGPDEALRLRHGIARLPKHMLTVGDTPRFLDWGGIIRFFKEENKIKIEINVSSAKAADLKLSSKLLNVSKIY